MNDWIDLAAAQSTLDDFEARLDPAHPERAGASVLAYGEISAALTLADSPALAGMVVKRMSGFADHASAAAYRALLDEYLSRLADLDIRTLDTAALTVNVGGRRPTVYLIQPLVPGESLGNRMLHDATDDELAAAVGVVLEQTRKAFEANLTSKADQISIDEQLSNWSFVPGEAEPVLIDVGTPFIRRGGQHAFDQEILLSAVPVGIRSYYRRKGTASEYMDDYFSPRLIAVDLVGNFHKEGAPARIPVALAAANEWLAGPGADLQRELGSSGGASGPITEAEVADYYKQDAATLELFLRVRRIDRAARRLLRQRYDFILPGKVQR